MSGRRIAPAAVLLILLAALFLRVYRLPGRGMIDTDESAYYNVGAFSAAVLRWRAGEEAASPSVRREKLEEYFARARVLPVTPVGTKPVYFFLLALAFLMAAPTPFHSLLVNAVLGAATVGLIFALARRLRKNLPYAPLAALGLALSGFHLIWSRSGFPHTSATFFLTLGWVFYARAVWGGAGRRALWLLASGLAQGAAFGAHPAVAPYLGVCFLTEAYRMTRSREAGRGVRNLFLLGAGVLLLPGVIEGFSWLLDRRFLPEDRWVFGGKKSLLYHAGLLTQGSNDLQYSRIPLGWRLSGLVWMPFLYGEGLVYTLLAAAGGVLCVRSFLREGRAQDFFVLAGTILPVAFYALSNASPYARNLAFLTPLAALLAARALEAAWNGLPTPAGRFCLVALFAAVQVWHGAYLFQVRSGYAQAAKWLAENGENRVLLSNVHSLWYPHGVRVYQFEKVEADGRIAAQEWPRSRPVLLSPGDRPLFIGFVKFRDDSLPEDFAGLMERDGEVVRFSNARPFTAKKIELLRFALRAARRSPFGGLKRWLDRQWAVEREIVDVGSVSLYRVKGSPAGPRNEGRGGRPDERGREVLVRPCLGVC